MDIDREILCECPCHHPDPEKRVFAHCFSGPCCPGPCYSCGEYVQFEHFIEHLAQHANEGHLGERTCQHKWGKSGWKLPNGIWAIEDPNDRHALQFRECKKCGARTRWTGDKKTGHAWLDNLFANGAALGEDPYTIADRISEKVPAW